ncbi:hypothetical protein Tco_0206890, partial [Tanacetum coccineum]
AEYDRALVSRVACRDGCLTCQRIPSTTEEISEGAVREVKEEMGVGVKPQMCISIFYLLPNADNALTLFQIDRYRVCRSNGIQWMPIEEFAAHSAFLRDKSRKFIYVRHVVAQAWLTFPYSFSQLGMRSGIHIAIVLWFAWKLDSLSH